LAAQIQRFQPEMAVVIDSDQAARLKKMVGSRTAIRYGADGYQTAASLASVDTVVTGVVGSAGLLPTLAAIDAGKTIALANKETLVMAGELVMARAREKGVDILPVDSEHSAIFQCLAGGRKAELDKILLTASGGPFRKRPQAEFATITPEAALAHPTWTMGKKISIDSATLMNKGLEVIEAAHLFAVEPARIEVVVHPQSIVHSMVAFVDGSVIAQLGVPDMKGAIAHALCYPHRLAIGQPVPDFAGGISLDFHAPDRRKFPCLDLAYAACTTGGTAPAVLNAANEVAVAAFLDHRIPFSGIPGLIQQTLNAHEPVSNPGLPEILAADRWARTEGERSVANFRL
jgi:1-deoxy-D-xylulose-5-phosphate reductoisomerase